MRHPPPFLFARPWGHLGTVLNSNDNKNSGSHTLLDTKPSSTSLSPNYFHYKVYS